MPRSGKTSQGGDGPGQGSISPECVKLLLERFPHVQMTSLDLLVRNEAFRELCEEYAACTEAARRLEVPGADEALRREYVALRLRLEGELLGYLSNKSGPGSNQ